MREGRTCCDRPYVATYPPNEVSHASGRYCGDGALAVVWHCGDGALAVVGNGLGRVEV